MTNTCWEEFWASYNRKVFNKVANLLQKPRKSTGINHILTNQPRSFQYSVLYETGLSDFYQLTLTALKVFHAKHKPSIIHHRNFNHVHDALFNELLR